MENMRTKGGNADFGINKWPVSQYGEFYQGTYLGVRLHLRVREVYWYARYIALSAFVSMGLICSVCSSFMFECYRYLGKGVSLTYLQIYK